MDFSIMVQAMLAAIGSLDERLYYPKLLIILDTSLTMFDEHNLVDL